MAAHPAADGTRDVISTVRFTEDEHDWLKAQAESQHRSFAAQLRYLVSLAREAEAEGKAA